MSKILVWYHRFSSLRPWINLFLVLLAIITVGLVFWTRSRVGVPVWVAPVTVCAGVFLVLGPILRVLAILSLSLVSPIPFVRRAAARALFIEEVHQSGWNDGDIEHALGEPDPGLLAPFVDARVRAVLRGRGAHLLGSTGGTVREAVLSGSVGTGSHSLPSFRRPFTGASSLVREGTGIIRAYASIEDATADGWAFNSPIGRLGSLVIHAQASHPKVANTLWIFDGVGDPSDMVPDTQRRFGRLRYARAETPLADTKSVSAGSLSSDRPLAVAPSASERVVGSQHPSPS